MTKVVMETSLGAIVPARVQSPSSIHLFKHCPRKYFYQYILKLRTLPNVHTIRGNVTHTVLEKFFDIDVSVVQKEFAEKVFKDVVQGLLVKYWNDASSEFNKIGLGEDKRAFYFEETLFMLFRWVEGFVKKLNELPVQLPEAFKKLTPVREQKFVSPTLSVQGYIDAIHTFETETVIVDYKTSSSFDVEEHRLQLAIYALLYYETYGVLPSKVGIHYLKENEHFLPVDEELLAFARKEIELIHVNTQSSEKKDYPKNITPLCKWSTGQCDFYDTCIRDD